MAAVLDSRSSTLTDNLVTPTPTKPAPYRIPARRTTLDKENVKPPVVTGKKPYVDALAYARRVHEDMLKTKKCGVTKEADHLTLKDRTRPNSNGYVDFPAFSDALARARRVQEYMKTKKGVDDLTVKDRTRPNSKKMSNKEVDLTEKSLLGPSSKKLSTNENKEVDLTEKSLLGPRSKNLENKQVDLIVKDPAGPTSEKVSIKDLEECFAGFFCPYSPDPSTLPIPTFLIKKPAMASQLIMV